MECNGPKKKKKSRATAIVLINAHFGVSVCKDVYTPLTHTDVKISPCSPYHNCVCTVPHTISQNLNVSLPNLFLF